MIRSILRRFTCSANSCVSEYSLKTLFSPLNLGIGLSMGSGAFWGYLLWGGNEDREKYEQRKIEIEVTTALNKECSDLIDKEFKLYFEKMQSFHNSLQLETDKQINGIIKDLDIQFNLINDHIHKNTEKVLDKLNRDGKEFFERVKNEHKW